MKTKNLLTLAVLALVLSTSTNTFAVNSATSAAVPVSLTLAGSCTIDVGATSGTFADGVSGAATTLTKSTTVSVNCTNTMPFKLGVDGGDNFAGTRNLASAGLTPISYVVKQGATAIGDADIVSYDLGYVSSALENAYPSVGTGAPQPIAVDFVATIPNAQASGTYTDSVQFVVAWP